jgi:hypothetical protein
MFHLAHGRASWAVRNALLEIRTDEDLLDLVRFTVRRWRALRLTPDEAQAVLQNLTHVMKLMARRSPRRNVVHVAKWLVRLLEKIDSQSRRTMLNRIEEVCDGLGPACRPVARELTKSPYRTAREFGFRLASRHRLTGFEEALRKEWDKPARWVATCSVELLGPLELQGLAWEIWQLSNARIRVKLLQRGVRVPLEWVNALHDADSAHWLILRCELGAPPDHDVAEAILAIAKSRPELIEMCRALARVNYVELLFHADEKNAERWAQLSRFAQGADDYSAPKLPNADNLSLWEDP